jgi:preprotein translocase subunit SecA
LSYSAPSADGDVEIRNQSGQVVTAPAKAGSSFGAGGMDPHASQPTPQRPGAPAPAAPPRPASPGANRAQRRAQQKRKR